MGRFRAIVKAIRTCVAHAKGFLARLRAQAIRAERIKADNSHFFHHCASIIQKFWRGFWSRRKLHDFYKRQKYWKNIVVRGERTIKCLNKEFEEKLHETS